VDSFGNSGQGGIEFTDRIAVTDPGGQYIYVADTDASRLLKVTRNGVPVSELTLPEGLQAWSWKPRALASLPDGRVFVADEGSGGIVITDPFDGLRRLSGPGNEASGVLLASGLACDGSTLALGDEVGGEIRLLDLHGNELARVSVTGTPGRLTLRADGLGAVVDEEGHVVRLFQGTAWSGVVHPWVCPEAFEPSAVCFAGDGSLLVADRAGHRILRLALPEVP
jgi:DNA-binding beta-propeller fold protein YncE